MKAKEWEDKLPRRHVDEEHLKEMVEVAAYFEMDGLIRAKYDHADASHRGGSNISEARVSLGYGLDTLGLVVGELEEMDWYVVCTSTS